MIIISSYNSCLYHYIISKSYQSVNISILKSEWVKFRSFSISNSTFDSYYPFYDTIDESFDIKYSSFTKNWKTTLFSISSFPINPISIHHSILHIFNSIHQLLTRNCTIDFFFDKTRITSMINTIYTLYFLNNKCCYLLDLIHLFNWNKYKYFQFLWNSKLQRLFDYLISQLTPSWMNWFHLSNHQQCIPLQ